MRIKSHTDVIGRKLRLTECDISIAAMGKHNEYVVSSSVFAIYYKRLLGAPTELYYNLVYTRRLERLQWPLNVVWGWPLYTIVPCHFQIVPIIKSVNNSGVLFRLHSKSPLCTYDTIQVHNSFWNCWSWVTLAERDTMTVVSYNHTSHTPTVKWTQTPLTMTISRLLCQFN